MSRYALEWAKMQRTATSEAKIILLLLADRAEGANHRCNYHAFTLAEEGAMPHSAVCDAVATLACEGLIESGALGAAKHNPVSPERPTEFRLLVPESWRCQASPRPKRDADGNDIPTAVYRFFDASGRLLYVGITDRPEPRFYQHEKTKHWWWEVATREIVWHHSRPAAEAEEYRAIGAESPVYNVLDVEGESIWALNLRQGKLRYVVKNGRYPAFESALGRMLADIDAGKYYGEALPPEGDLAARYDVKPIVVEQVLARLCAMGVIEVADDGSRREIDRESW